MLSRWILSRFALDAGYEIRRHSFVVPDLPFTLIRLTSHQADDPMFMNRMGDGCLLAASTGIATITHDFKS